MLGGPQYHERDELEAAGFAVLGNNVQIPARLDLEFYSLVTKSEITIYAVKELGWFGLNP